MLGDTPGLLPKHLHIDKLAAAVKKTPHTQNIYFQETVLSTFIISSFLWVFFLWLYKAVFFPNVMWHISQLYVNMLGKCFASTWFLTFAAPLFENWRQMSQKYRLLISSFFTWLFKASSPPAEREFIIARLVMSPHYYMCSFLWLRARWLLSWVFVPKRSPHILHVYSNMLGKWRLSTWFLTLPAFLFA